LLPQKDDNEIGYSSQSESFSERNFIGLCPKKGDIK